jgi:hypothetical protein
METLDKLANHFEIDKRDLINILHSTEGEILGGSLLPCFLEEPFYDNQDLDIFVRLPIKCHTKQDGSEINSIMYRYEHIMLQFIDNILEKNGYNCAIKKGRLMHQFDELFLLDEAQYNNSPLTNYLKNVSTYKKNMKKIQIIVLYNCDMADFVKLFDLNICKLSLRAENIANKLTRYLDEKTVLEIRDKKMRLNLDEQLNKNQESRLQKYRERGFTLIEE